MMHLNLAQPRRPGAWSRIRARARRMPPEMFAAYAAMRAEQKREGEALGFCACDLPWCNRVASHRWVRTAKEIKASRVKYKGCATEMNPVSVRCEVHVPFWRAGVYVPVVFPQSAEKAS